MTALDVLYALALSLCWGAVVCLPVAAFAAGCWVIADGWARKNAEKRATKNDWLAALGRCAERARSMT